MHASFLDLEVIPRAEVGVNLRDYYFDTNNPVVKLRCRDRAVWFLGI